ncbi:MAG: TVP38/TMEM64 family protein [Clostridia bacterium]|nr:TVP38/TMEM64 family protein [Clostridia bacterium]
MKALIEKAKNFIKERQKQIKGFAVVFLIVLLISLVTYFILLATGVLVHGEEGIEFDASLFDAYKNEWYGGLIIMLLQTVLTMLLCFIPGISMAFIMLINQLYGGDPLGAFGISFASVMVSSSVLYILGRFGGYKLCEKLLGEEDTEKALGLLRDNGTVYFPLMMMFPVFPDDALTMVAGTIKMKLAWFIPSIVIGRGIGTAAIIFGMAAFLPAMEKTYDWFILITILMFGLYCILYLANSLNKMMAEKREGTYKPFSFKNLKPEDIFATFSTVTTAVVGISIFSNPRLLPSMGTLYIWFELFVVMVFYLLITFLTTRAVYRAYKRHEKHGKIRVRRVRPTLGTLLPSMVSLGVIVIFTIVASAIGFFPDIVLPYDWIVVFAAYIIWAIAIYMVTNKISVKVRKALNKKKKEKAAK